MILSYLIGPECKRFSTEFNQDSDYTGFYSRYLFQQFGIEHIGAWHSHHQLGLTRPSGGDDNTMKTSLIANRVPRALCIIATIENHRVILHCYLYIVKENKNVQRVECEIQLISGAQPFYPLMMVTWKSLTLLLNETFSLKDVEYIKGDSPEPADPEIDGWFQVYTRV
jgi:hypothetical protein